MNAVEGDSMEPVASSGDRILNDVNCKVPVPPGTVVVWDGLGLVTKRIRHVPNFDPPRAILKSSDPDYDSYNCLADEVHVVGHAAWVYPATLKMPRADRMQCAAGIPDAPRPRCPCHEETASGFGCRLSDTLLGPHPLRD